MNLNGHGLPLVVHHVVVYKRAHKQPRTRSTPPSPAHGTRQLSVTLVTPGTQHRRLMRAASFPYFRIRRQSYGRAINRRRTVNADGVGWGTKTRQRNARNVSAAVYVNNIYMARTNDTNSDLRDTRKSVEVSVEPVYSSFLYRVIENTMRSVVFRRSRTRVYDVRRATSEERYV